MDRQGYREVIGEWLKKFREERGLNTETISVKGKISIDKIDYIENGSENYTIDEFLSYIIGSDLYLFLSEKSEDRNNPHDFADMLNKMQNRDPNL
ncbi:MAG: hypothetical protein PUB21_07845 [Bacteroidales bacterium]|nr:hypothetical protein [Bacteroidales bacterium]